ncbi:c-type cytochrome [Pseudooceanicola sp. CBS1P-1]|uniref:C-type cytochrome n=1 Tax=Pseudooceanicola albus TaxID=2692189 RepID=A0A6L7G023_9RHOB|nr:MULTISPECIES: c-type cytochrome [Pseudooceanicola]MBT9383576.1 c-type cytochrome [Pseudooceanicola endophyticus]MXN17431.1 c-type cytochrome [Pseudooceanicola albus]
MAFSAKSGLAALALAGLAATSALADDSDLVKRGEYLTTAADCAACHTAPTGGKAFAGGYAISSPMGEIIATNITPSKDYGIGNWSEAQFAKAVRQGVAPGGVHLYPAMPYPSYAKLTDDDIAAIYAYLMKSVAPVDEAPAKKTQLGFPFNIRAMMIGWNMMFTPGTGWTPPKGLTDEQERGAYLVQALEHCSTCHTPRGFLMNTQNASFLGGASLGSWRAPNITPDKATGIGTWSEDDIVSYLRDGHATGKASAAGPMAEAIDHSMRHLSEADLKAMAAYLKVVPAISTPEDAPTRAAADALTKVALTSYETTSWTGQPDSLAKHDTTDAATLYNGGCAACHGVDGKGAKDGHFPDLTTASSVTSKDPSNLVMTITDGISRHDGTGYTAMPAFRNDLDNDQIAALTTYVSSTFGGSDVKVDGAKVAQIRAGGPAPWLATNAGWLTWVAIVVAVVVVLLIIALIVGLTRRRA